MISSLFYILEYHVNMKPNELITEGNKMVDESGIYMILCLSSNKAYIGQSKNIYRRWSQHKNLLKNNNHFNSHLQNIYNKYGKDSLHYIVLENTDNLSLNEREGYYINSLDDDYKINLGPIQDVVPMSEEHKRNISKSSIGKKMSEESKIKMSIQRRGRHSSLRGIPRSAETKEKISNTLKEIPGRQHSEETKIKIANAQKFISDETRRKRSESVKASWILRKQKGK